MQNFLSLIGSGPGAVVREIVEIPDDLIPGKDIFTSEFAKTLVQAADGVQVGDVQQPDGSFLTPAAEAPPVLVPMSVTSAQAKIQLRRAGLRDKVDAAVQAAGGEVLDWFTDARTWERDNQHVLDIGASLNLKSSDIDALFSSAAKIVA